MESLIIVTGSRKWEETLFTKWDCETASIDGNRLIRTLMHFLATNMIGENRQAVEKTLVRMQ